MFVGAGFDQLEILAAVSSIVQAATHVAHGSLHQVNEIGDVVPTIVGLLLYWSSFSKRLQL